MKRLNLIYYLPRARGWLYTSPFVTSAALLLEAEQLTFGDQAQRLHPAQPVLACRLRSHRAVTIYLDYSSACKSACRSNAIGRQLLSQYTYSGCQGGLIFSAKRGGHAYQRQSVSKFSPMWRSIDVAAAANPRKISWSRWCTHKTYAMHRQEGK